MSLSRWSGLRAFLLIWCGQVISAVGSRLSRFALGIWVLRTTGSTTKFALTFIATAIPAICISPFAGALVDRWDRRRILIVCDGLSTTLMVGLAGLLASGHLSVFHVYLASSFTSLFDTFRSPALTSSIPLVTPTQQLSRANALVQTGEAAAAIGGPLLAGTLVSLIRFQGVVLIDALTFVAGMVTLALVNIPHRAVAVEARASLWREAAAGFEYVRQRAGLFGLLGVYGYIHFVFAMASVLIAPLLLSFSTPAMLGLQYAISGCGLLVGGLAMASTGGPKKQVRAVLGYTVLGGLCLAAHGLSASFILVATFGLVLFMTLPVVDASNTSIWQKKVPSQLQGRCFAIQQFLLNIAMALGFALAGPLSDRVFEPWLTARGLLANSVGSIIGVGPGRGIGLIFICLGVSMALVALCAYCAPAIREIDEMQDESFSAAAVGSALNDESIVVARF
jgi:MFS transporter, DHA3 family, macrolide efflux protein